MKLIYTKQEVLEIMRNHIADLLDVKITDLNMSYYIEDFLEITCTKIDKPKRASRWIKDESYRDPAPAAPELE